MHDPSSALRHKKSELILKQKSETLQHIKEGSPFIQAFCQTMNDFGHCCTLDQLLKKTTKDLQRRNPPQSPEYRSVGVPTDLVFTRTKLPSI